MGISDEAYDTNCCKLNGPDDVELLIFSQMPVDKINKEIRILDYSSQITFFPDMDEVRKLRDFLNKALG